LPAALASCIALAACGGGSGTEVDLRGHEFAPSTITVVVGATVKWTNDTDEVHTVTAYQDGVPAGGSYFASGGAKSEREARDDLDASLIDRGETFEFRFTNPGTYRYFCIPHESQGMKGTVVVKGR
jgi:plastocyanin